MSVDNLPLVSDQYIQSIFGSLSKMDVDLDSDPLVYGPKRMTKKVAQCRDHLSRCQQIFLQISDDMQRLKRAHRKAKLDFDLAMQDLLANDLDVRAGKNVRDREAVATMKLRAEREHIANIESSIQDLEAVMTVVKAKREDLKDIQGRLRDQVKLCQEEIGLGGRWGSAPGPDIKAPDLNAAPKVDPRAIYGLNSMVAGLDGETSITDLDSFVAFMSESEQKAGGALAGGAISDEEDSDEEDSSDEDSSEVNTTAEAPPDEEQPVVVAVETEVSEVLPVVAEVFNPMPASANNAEVDAFFNDLQLDTASAQSAQAAPPKVSAQEIDLDDLIGSFGV